MFQSGLKPVYFDEIENYHDLVEVLGRNEQWYTLGERLGYIQSDLDNIKKGMYTLITTVFFIKNIFQDTSNFRKVKTVFSQ